MKNDMIEESIDRILGAYADFVKKVSEAYAVVDEETPRVTDRQGRPQDDRT